MIDRMRRRTTWLAVLVVAAMIPSPSLATTLVATPSKPGYWTGTRLKLDAERSSRGRLRVRVEGTIAAGSAGRVVLSVDGCGANTDAISSYRWTPESHPLGRQAIPANPAYQQSGTRLEMTLRGKRRVSQSVIVGYGYLDDPSPDWTDCVSMGLFRQKKNGGDFGSAFDPAASTLYVSVGVADGRHIECGKAPAFCLPQRPNELSPPALPDFPPAPGYPGSPGYGDVPGWPYRVCPIPDGRFVLC